MYAQYIKEKCNAELIQTERGFITYSVNGDSVHIHDAYVLPEYRGRGESKALVDEVIRRTEAKKLTSCLQINSNDMNQTLITQLCFGFKLVGASEKELYLVKEL